jgi:hypothetical protein
MGSQMRNPIISVYWAESDPDVLVRTAVEALNGAISKVMLQCCIAVPLKLISINRDDHATLRSFKYARGRDASRHA